MQPQRAGSMHKTRKGHFGTQLFIGIVEHENMACYLLVAKQCIVGCSLGRKKNN